MNAKPGTQNSKIRVLLIEDDPGDADYLMEMLAEVDNYSINLVCTDRLETGLARLGEGEFDVVLLDLSLPDSQGLDTFIKVHDKTPEIAIVVLSGLDDETTAVEALHKGAQDYLVKGQVGSNLLVRSICYAIERRQILAKLEQQTKELSASEERLRTIIEKSANSSVVVNKDGLVRFVNPAAQSLFGRKADELIGGEFKFPLEPDKTVEVNVDRKGGETAIAELHVTKTKWEGEMAYLASLYDITKRKQMENILEEMAHFDTLTGLPNRQLFFDRFNQTIALAKRNNSMFALLFLDLDGFKNVNDTYGHDTGDSLLKEASKRLMLCVRESDTVARMGGDEFTILLTKIAEKEDAVFVARKIIDSLNQPFNLLDYNCNIGVSIGICIYPSGGDDLKSLLGHADVAMYNVKKQGRNGYQFYTSGMNNPG